MSETQPTDTNKIIITMPEGNISDRAYQILREAANKLVVFGNTVELTNMNVIFELFTEEDQKKI